MARADAFLLTVLSGPNAGASAALPKGSGVIGGAAGDSVVLDGVAPSALRIVLDGQRMRVQAAADGLALIEGRTTRALANGQAHIGALPAILRLGPDTTIAISRAHPQTTGQVPLRRAVFITAIALMAGLVAGVQMPSESGGFPGLEAFAARHENPDLASFPKVSGTGISGFGAAGMDAASPTPTRADPAPATRLHSTSPRLRACAQTCQKEAATTMQHRLEKAGLDGLQITPGDGVLRVSGTLPAGKSARWRDLRHQFETDFGTSLPLIVDIAQGPDMPVLAVASVWLGTTPELRTKTGQTLRQGDTTTDGWTVTRIERGRIGLTRDARRVEIRF